MTYNIHVGIGMDKKLDLQRIAAVITDQHPDLVGLQEVDRGVERTQRIDEIAEIAKMTEMDYAFAFNLSYQGGQYVDYIFYRSSDRVRARHAWIVDTLASDHVPVVADLEIGT